MPSDLGFYPFACVLFILLCLLLYRLWRRGKTTPSARKPPRPKREPEPFAGLTCKPDCEACEQGAGSHPRIPGAPPPRMMVTRRRHRQVDTSGHFCPHAPCAYHGWIGFGNLRANGHPNGRRWRQLLCLGCNGYFLETTGTPFHAKQIEPDRLVWAIAALAEGLGIRAVARVFEVDPGHGAHLVGRGGRAPGGLLMLLSARCGCRAGADGRTLCAARAVKDGEVTADEAIQRLSRSPHWVWVAMDPVSKLFLTFDVGEHTLAMAQHLVHQGPAGAF